MSITQTKELCCANWVGWLADRQKISNYDWVCWSNDYWAEGLEEFIESSKNDIKTFPIRIIKNEYHRLNEEYDLIFLIQSYEYSPPHMYHRFRELYETLPNLVIGKDRPLRFISYADSVKKVGADGLAAFLREEFSQYTGELLSVFIDPWEVPEYDPQATYTEDDLMSLRKEISRDEFIKMFGECDPLYAA